MHEPGATCSRTIRAATRAVRLPAFFTPAHRCDRVLSAVPTLYRRAQTRTAGGSVTPLRLHPVTVREIDGTRVKIGPSEVFNGTPVVDIKSASTRADG